MQEVRSRAVGPNVQGAHELSQQTPSIGMVPVVMLVPQTMIPPQQGLPQAGLRPFKKALNEVLSREAPPLRQIPGPCMMAKQPVMQGNQNCQQVELRQMQAQVLQVGETAIETSAEEAAMPEVYED